MDHAAIKEKLSRILGIIGEWEGRTPVEIEKDIVLKEIADLYASLKYVPSTCGGEKEISGQADSPPDVIAAPVDKVANEDATARNYVDTLAEIAGAPEGIADIQPGAGSDTSAPAEEAPAAVSGAPEYPVEGFTSDGSLEEAATVVPPVELPEPQPVQQDHYQSETAQPQPERTDETVTKALFSEDEIPVRPVIDRNKLLSLYGDDTPANAPADREPSVPEPGTTFANGTINTEGSGNFPVNDEKTISKDSPLAQKPGAVLGEVIATAETTLGDTYSRNNPSDLATVISSGQVNDLRKAVGVNDKYLLLRDLFEGDNDKYEKAIGELDNCADLDDAMLYMHDNFNKDPNSEGVKLLVDLLSRKFS